MKMDWSYVRFYWSIFCLLFNTACFIYVVHAAIILNN